MVTQVDKALGAETPTTANKLKVAGKLAQLGSDPAHSLPPPPAAHLQGFHQMLRGKPRQAPSVARSLDSGPPAQSGCEPKAAGHRAHQHRLHPAAPPPEQRVLYRSSLPAWPARPPAPPAPPVPWPAPAGSGRLHFSSSEGRGPGKPLGVEDQSPVGRIPAVSWVGHWSP